MPLMGNLYIGSSGLQTSQNALNTTAHNLSNMETAGFVRQQVQQSNKSYLKISTNPKAINNMQTGLGVTYSRVKHIRDEFLDKMYRKESGRSMFYEVSMETLEEVEGQLGEMNGRAFQNTITDFWTSIQELAKDPASSVTQGLLVQRAAELVQRAEAVYSGLSAYQDNLNAQVKVQVDKINTYGKQLLVLNESIRTVEAGGVEMANDLRDTRDYIIDELSKLVDINYGENVNGSVWVQIEGMDFVKGDSCYEIGLYTDHDTGFYTPFWYQNARYVTAADGSRMYTAKSIEGAEVFDLTREISSDLNTDIGGLKAMLWARGDHRADYTDMAPGKYEGVSQSVIMNIQAEFDQLIHNIATKVNEVFATAAGVEKATSDITVHTADGDVVLKEGMRYCENDVGGYMRRDDGSPIQVFAKIGSDGYRRVTGTVDVLDAAGNPTGATEKVDYWVYNEENPATADGLYTLKNLQIDPELMQKPSMLGMRLADGSEDKATADALKEAFTEEAYKLNPNVQKSTTIVDYYSDLVSQVANTGYVYRSIYTNQTNAVESINSAREQVIGVSSDEELSNMIKFQNAYNASSRYINVIDEMLEHILNTLGA